MIISSGEFIMSHVSRCPMKMLERRSLQGGELKNWVVEAYELMSNRRNGLGWGVGTEVKIFVKDVMET